MMLVHVRRVLSSVSALLALLLPVVAAAQPRPPASPAAQPLSLFPLTSAWTQPLDGASTAPPAFAGVRAFVPLDGTRVVALDLEHAVVAWILPGTPLSTPATGDGLVFVAERDRITAVHEEDGRPAWRLPFEEPLAAPLVWDNGWLVAADTAGTLYAFRATDGELIWRQPLGRPVHVAPALAADRVYAALEDGHVVSLDVSTGTERWTTRLGGAPADMLALEDRIYVGSDDNYLYCLLASSGEIDWRWRTGGDVTGAPVVDDARVYFVSQDNVLRALDRKSGAQRWKRALGVRPTRGIVRARDVLLVSGLPPKLFGFAVKDGNPAGDITASGELASVPYVLPGGVLPTVVLVARDLAQGTRVTAFRRTIDQPMNPPLRDWPGVITAWPPAQPQVPTAPSTAASEPPR